MVAAFMGVVSIFAQGGTTGPLTWNLNGGTLTISGNGDMPDYSNFQSTPWYLYQSSITSVVIQKGVTKIGSNAFNNCSQLKNVYIEAHTNKLKFSETDEGHFKNSPVETLYLGRNLEPDSWNRSPFADNLALQAVTIGNDVTAINNNSFNNCTGLNSLKLGDELQTIGFNAFKNCSSLSSPLILPPKLKTIGGSAFQDCREVLSLTIPKSVTSIGGQAFNNCFKLKNVYIADHTTENLEFSETDEGHFKNSPIETLYLGRNLKPDSWNRSPFAENEALRTVTIGNNVTAINNNSFNNCTELDSLTLGNMLKTIGFNAFKGCSSLAIPLILPQGLQTIGSRAFQDCRKISSVSFPNSVTSIGSQSFNNCFNLTCIVNFRANPPSVENDCFVGVDIYCTVCVPIGSINLYNAAVGWIDFKNINECASCDDVGIENYLADQLKIYPNPGQTEIYIKSDLEIEKVEIYSITGALLRVENNFKETISVSDLAKGIYLLNVYTDKGLVNSKFVKE